MDGGTFAERLASARETRARLPEIVRNRHATRRHRQIVGHSGRLLLIEADQMARGDFAAGADPMALADRAELLSRLVLALERPRVDGVIGTTDLIDDLALLEVIDRKLAIGSMNRGGLAGSSFALDDRFTGYEPEMILGSHLEGGKLRLSLDPMDPRTPRAIEACGRAVTALSAGSVMALVEPVWYGRSGDAPAVDLSTEAILRAVGIAAGVGGRSGYTWLALPDVEDLRRIVGSTTLPIIIRASGPIEAGLDRWARAMTVPGVHGISLSVESLFSTAGDLADALDELALSVHGPLPPAPPDSSPYGDPS